MKQNKGRIPALVALSSVVCVLTATSASAQQWSVVYQTDFSTDPGWVSSNASRNYWDRSSQRYHVMLTDGSNDCAYIDVALTPGASYKLEYDLYVTRSDWAGDVRFGLSGTGMRFGVAPAIFVDYCLQDFGGRVIGEFSYDSGGGSFQGGDPYTAQYVLNKTYHNELVLNAEAGSLTLTVSVDGIPYAAQTVFGLGRFIGLHRLCATSIGDDYARGQTGEGFLDNVAIYEAVAKAPSVSLIKEVTPSFSGLSVGTNYQLQVSANMAAWTNHGLPFIATNSNMVYPQSWGVDNWSQLFFRLRVAP